MNPFFNKNSILVINNIKIHYYEKLINLNEKIDYRILFLPSYSPDYNPIEIAFFTLKT